MKLNNIKTGLLLAGLLLLFGNVKAQDNPFKPEWFVSGGINGVTALNGSANNILGGKVSGGVWLNKIIGRMAERRIQCRDSWCRSGYPGEPDEELYRRRQKIPVERHFRIRVQLLFVW